ncbi:MAG: S8 family serine peptidase, partial [Myxococcales bacterium]|nr:S8 family serine peptidase [Myxococcales bacterium]
MQDDAALPRPHLTTGLTTGLSTGLSSRLRSSLVSLLAVGLVACSDGPATPKAHAPPEDPARTLVDGPSSAEYLAHEVVVRRPTGMSLVELTQIFEELGIQQLDADSLLTRELGYWRLALPADLEADAAIEELSKRGFEAPERNYVMRVDAVPDDPQLSALWGMAKIGAGEAWDHSTGTRTVLVAVTDTGVDRDHPDLVANLWTNSGEIPGNGLDDDGNGYVDDVSGWDTANGDADPEDDHGHGTHVSGTIGAIGNNGVGVAGVSWNVSIIPVKACTGQGSCYTTATAEALLYTAKVKADVINASWGGPGYVSYLHDAVKQVAAAGGLLVAAAGNKSTNNDYTKNYPSSYPEDNVLAVAATDSNDTLAYFSNYGATEVDLAAPGVGILSTVPGGGYAQMSGTSMASPHVAGAAGLLLAHAPAWTYHDLRARLLDYTDRVPGLAGRVVTGGRLNVNRAMVELNECLGENDCDANATCNDTAEGYTCTCKSGFVGDGTTCSDVDECADQTAGCHANATCTNLPGSFSCACKPGFAGNGTMCKDVDECASGLAGCSANATCHNTAGSFSCTCKDGFTGDGYACFDVDECALGQ